MVNGLVAKSFDTFCPLGPSLVPLQGAEESRDTKNAVCMLEQCKLSFLPGLS